MLESTRRMPYRFAPAAVPGLDVGRLAVHDGVDVRQRHRDVDVQLRVRLVARAPLLLLQCVQGAIFASAALNAVSTTMLCI
jgi:hypothetical protein